LKNIGDIKTNNSNGLFQRSPTDIKLWTPEEINDWKIEEWLKLLEVRKSAK